LRRFCNVQLKRAFVITLFVGIASLAIMESDLAQNESAIQGRNQESFPAQDSWLYEQAVSQLQWNHQEVARQLFMFLIEKYPDSSYLPQAKLGIADSFFQEGGSDSIAKARQLYEEWLKIFPDSTIADQVMLKLADTTFKLCFKDPLTFDKLAERHLKALLKHFPDTPLRPQVEERLQKVQEDLAMHELKVALFNLERRQAVIGAQMRLLVITRDYPHFPQMAQVLFLLAKTYQDDPDTKDTNTAEAIRCYQQLICQFPDSPFTKEANQQLLLMGSAPSIDCNVGNDNRINF
jgi:outer membrane protein assembly factor BamD